MRDGFEEYFDLSEGELKQLWGNCLFVFDTNALLSLFRDKKSTSDDLINVIRSLDGRIWLPHQVALEFHRNRAGVIIGNKKIYQPLRNAIEAARGEAQKSLKKSIDGFKHHPVMTVSEAVMFIDNKFNSIISDIDVMEKSSPQEEHYQDVFQFIVEAFSNATGLPYSEEKIKEVLDDGKKSCEAKIPPGYIDFKEKEDLPLQQRIGDYILWQQMIDHSAVVQRPVIFVTDDVKEDWWREVKGEKIGPRLELVREFMNKSSQRFYIYTRYRFLERAREFLNVKVKNETIDDVKITSIDKYTGDDESLVAPEVSSFMVDVEEYINFRDHHMKSNPVSDNMPKGYRAFEAYAGYYKIKNLEKKKEELQEKIGITAKRRKYRKAIGDIDRAHQESQRLIDLGKELDKVVDELYESRKKYGMSYFIDDEDEAIGD
ncbi:PIN domain-containing protein [Azospirillum argentinense]|uniref:PIN domain-containing protein n=1 Tax=Azospirillum argentinense TaxID=2970906 RepID=UPI00118614FA|nr:PIN domain-containing protein [Azospirillum argentinense]